MKYIYHVYIIYYINNTHITYMYLFIYVLCLKKNNKKSDALLQLPGPGGGQLQCLDLFPSVSSTIGGVHTTLL